MVIIDSKYIVNPHTYEPTPTFIEILDCRFERTDSMVGASRATHSTHPFCKTASRNWMPPAVSKNEVCEGA